MFLNGVVSGIGKLKILNLLVRSCSPTPGTGYYYSRFRPGLGSVLVFLAILSSGIQYAIQLINRRRDLQRIERFVRLGKAAGYGPKGIPTEGKRKVRVPLTELSEEANRGRMIDLLVDGSDVYMVRHLFSGCFAA